MYNLFWEVFANLIGKGPDIPPKIWPRKIPVQMKCRSILSIVEAVNKVKSVC